MIIFPLFIKAGIMYDLSDPTKFDSFFQYSSFFDINTKSIFVTNSLFCNINAHKTAVIYASKSENKDFEIVCISNTFQHLTSEEGTCAIKVCVSNVLLRALCFSDIAASYKATENGGTCVSLNESSFNISGLSLIRTNYNDHASIYVHSDSSGKLSVTNTSYGETLNTGDYTNGLRIWSKVSIEIAYCSFAHLKGGCSILSDTNYISQGKHIIFTNSTAENDVPIVKIYSNGIRLDDCACYSCGPRIGYTQGSEFERWYFVDCKPDMQYFANTVSVYDDFDLTINMICHVPKSIHKHSSLKVLLGMILIIPL